MKTITKDKSADEKIRIVIEFVDNDKLGEEQQKIVGNNPVFDLSVWVGDKQIHDFNGIITVKLIKIPKNIKSGDYDLLTVYYIDDDGNIQEMKDSKYDATAKTITFTTNYLSKFFVSLWINPFSDIKKTDAYYRAVRYVYSNSLMIGTAVDKFEPDGSLTRAMFVTILYRYEGAPSVENYNAKFNDVENNQWYTDAIAWANANGIAQSATVRIYYHRTILIYERQNQ